MRSQGGQRLTDWQALNFFLDIIDKLIERRASFGFSPDSKWYTSRIFGPGQTNLKLMQYFAIFLSNILNEI